MRRPAVSTEIDSPAAPATIHELLVDVDAWSLWSPHVASVVAENRRISPGWIGATRAFFSPGPTSMVVDDVRPDGGFAWHSTILRWRLDYDNKVAPANGGSTIRFTARLSGPASAVIERLVGPLSTRGQRRRMARLALLAELVEGAPTER